MHIPTDSRCKNRNSVQKSYHQMGFEPEAGSKHTACIFWSGRRGVGEFNAHEIDL